MLTSVTIFITRSWASCWANDETRSKDMADDTIQFTEPDQTIAERNALRNLLSQLGDPDAAHEAGVIDDDSYIEQKAKKMAYTAALAAYDRGETPDVPALLGQMREQASKPTQTEQNTANIDYLLMTVGGDQ